MELIQDFRSISKRDVASAGGKGASLGEMTRAKLPVPPGFVLTSSAFDRFFRENELSGSIESIMEKIDYTDVDSVSLASSKIRSLIARAVVSSDLSSAVLEHFLKLKSKYVAVRSSATAEDGKAASWAGELETYLNTTKSSLLVNVKHCWSSLFTPRAIMYRHEKKLLKKKVSVAVVVQSMIQSEVSGIAFTVHPVTENKHHLLIEAGLGLGESVVSGMITPDSYIVDKRHLSLEEVVVNQQQVMLQMKSGRNVKVKLSSAKGGGQKLSDAEITELAKLCKKIEAHYGFPCDIEWANDGKSFFVVQSRPITTLSQKT